MRRIGAEVLIGLAALGLAGCDEELGPERMPTTRVVGRVRVGSRPVAGGWVEFHPAGGTIGVLRSAPIRPDGTFEADGIAIGLNAIQIAHPPTPLPGELRRLERQPWIRREIAPTPGAVLDLDLREEWRRLVREQAAG